LNFATRWSRSGTTKVLAAGAAFDAAAGDCCADRAARNMLEQRSSPTAAAANADEVSLFFMSRGF
jgi:hypothetical protein